MWSHFVYTSKREQYIVCTEYHSITGFRLVPQAPKVTGRIIRGRCRVPRPEGPAWRPKARRRCRAAVLPQCLCLCRLGFLVGGSQLVMRLGGAVHLPNTPPFVSKTYSYVNSALEDRPPRASSPAPHSGAMRCRLTQARQYGMYPWHPPWMGWMRKDGWSRLGSAVSSAAPCSHLARRPMGEERRYRRKPRWDGNG